MKKLMILMAAVATSAFALGADSLKNVFDATTASDLSSWDVPVGDDKAVLANGVLTLATGSDAASYWVKDESTPYAMGENLYFDVSLDLLGQALDEVPTLPGDAKLALFLLDTTEIDGAPAGTNLYALAKHPTETATVLMKLNADVETLTSEDAFTRLTVQTYKNVFKSGETANSAFVVYQNGGETDEVVSPVKLDCYYTFKDDGSVNWKSPKSVDGSYLSGMLDAAVSGKRTCLLLSVKSGVDGQSFTALDFTGNAKIKKVEINDSGFGFIAADVKVTTITLEGVSITVDPASAYDATKGTLSASCTITVTKNPGMEILTYTPMNSTYLVDNGNGTFTYTYAEGNDVSFKAVAACATVNGKAYETIDEVMTALGTLTEAGQSGTLKLSRDIGASDLFDGFLTIGGTVTLDLAGRKIVAPVSADGLGTVTCSGGSLTIIDSATGGCIESEGEGGVAVCSAEDSTILIQSGIFKGQIRDMILEAADEEAQESEGEPTEGETTTEEGASEEVAASIIITGGSFSVEPDERLIAEGYVATQGDDGYWTVAQGEALAEVSFTLTIPDGAKVSAMIEIDSESVEMAPKTLKKGQSYKVTFTAVKGYQFAADVQTVFEGTAEADAIEIEAPTVTAIAYTITYSWTGVEDADTEKIENKNPATYTIEDEITFTAPTCEGHTFKGFDVVGIELGSTGDKTVTGTFEKSSTPMVDPVAPGKKIYESEADAANAAAAINANKTDLITAPEGVTDKAAYAALFEATADGSTVTVDLTAKAKADIQTQVDDDLKAVDVAGIAAAETDETELSITAEPGLYYSVKQGKTLGEMVEGLRQKVNAKGEVLKLKATKYSGSGFYKILVNTSDKPSAE